MSATTTAQSWRNVTGKPLLEIRRWSVSNFLTNIMRNIWDSYTRTSSLHQIMFCQNHERADTPWKQSKKEAQIKKIKCTNFWLSTKTFGFHKRNKLTVACGKVTGDKTKNEKPSVAVTFCEMRFSPDLFSFPKLWITSTRNAHRLLFFCRPFTFPGAFHIHREVRCSKNTTKMQSYVAIGGRHVKVATIDTCSCDWEEQLSLAIIVYVLSDYLMFEFFFM